MISSSNALDLVAAYKLKLVAKQTIEEATNTSGINLLFVGNSEDKNYSPMLKDMVGLAKVYTRYTDPITLSELTMYCKERNITGVFTTSAAILKKLLEAISSDNIRPSVDNYAGSYFYHQGIEYIIIHPLCNFYTVPYQKFLTQRFISKLTNKKDWHENPEFKFILINASNFDSCFAVLNGSEVQLISVDIETTKERLGISCIGYSASIICNRTNKYIIHSYVIPLTDMYQVTLMRKINWETKAPKVMQNGKYDALYLARWNAPLYNWQFDTITMFHCWYAEMPKDLGFITAFFVRKVQYWKDLAKTNDKYEYYKYNALDSFGTLLAATEWLLTAPDWAKKNYLLEFPVNFACHLTELTGYKLDNTRLKRAAAVYNKKIDSNNISLSKMVGTYPRIFNVNSAPQNKALRKVLGCAHIESSDETSLKKIGLLHPINKRITNKILDIRGDRKLVSTYLVEGKDLNSRILYAINPHGTETGRMASRESAFWCGLQIQNITRGKAVKQTAIADTGFRWCECDSSKAETWDTAYLSGDKNLIAVLNTTQDFHSINASAFFGVPYDEIFDDVKGKAIDKALRDLAKRVNHGANYLMGKHVLLDTMGEEAVWKTKRLLKLPQSYGLLDITEHLLKAFHSTYSSLAKVYYPSVVQSVMNTKLLTGGQGWTRYCFGNPKTNKRDMNAYVAHRSQSENAIRLNRAFMKVFYEIAMNPEYSDNFKLIAQIHDSILFQFRIGHEYLCEMVRKCMELEVTVTSADSKVRSYTVPADLKMGKNNKGAHRWSLTE